MGVFMTKIIDKSIAHGRDIGISDMNVILILSVIKKINSLKWFNTAKVKII